jgi:Complex I intermediate-associated protein 30 (CIA30)
MTSQRRARALILRHIGIQVQFSNLSILPRERGSQRNYLMRRFLSRRLSVQQAQLVASTCRLPARNFFGDFFKMDGLESVNPICIVGDNSNVSVKWKSLSDVDYGGTSTCEIATSDGNKLVMSGVVHFPDSSTGAKGGFCATKGVLSRVLDLRDYEGFELTVRADPPMDVILNMATRSLFEDDLYQICIPIRRESSSILVRFSDFKLTARGSERELQRCNDSLQLESFGFLVNKIANVPFHLHVDKLVALHRFERNNHLISGGNS